MRLSPGLPRLRLPAQPSLWQSLLRRQENLAVHPLRGSRCQAGSACVNASWALPGWALLPVPPWQWVANAVKWGYGRRVGNFTDLHVGFLRSYDGYCGANADALKMMEESAVYWGCFGLALDVGSVALRNILHTRQMWMTYFMARSPGHVKGPADAARGFPVYVSPLFRGSMLPKTLWKSEAMAVRPLKPAAACSLDQWSYSSTPLMAAFYPRCEGAMCPDYQGPCGWALNSCWWIHAGAP